MSAPVTDARFFASPAQLRRWLAEHHATATELWVGLHRKHSGRPTVTWSELIDQALCFGWIDGIRKPIDPDRYTIRVTPRKRDSIWSRVNVGRVAVLTRLKLMTPAGSKAFKARTAKKTAIYSFENRPKKLAPAYEKEFKARPDAWAFFRAQAPWYQRLTIYRVMSAKKEETRLRRLSQLIVVSAAGRRLDMLSPGKP